MPTPAETKAFKKDKEDLINQLQANLDIIYPLLYDGAKQMLKEQGWSALNKAFNGLPIELEPDVIKTLQSKGMWIDENGRALLATPNGRAAYPVRRTYYLLEEAKTQYPLSLSTGVLSKLTTVVKQTTYVPDRTEEGKYKQREDILRQIDSQILMNEQNIKEAIRVNKPSLVALFQKEIDNLQNERVKVEATNYAYLEACRHILEDLKDNPLLVKAKKCMDNAELIAFGNRLISFDLLNYPVNKAGDVIRFNDLLVLIEAIKLRTPEGINPVVNRLNWLNEEIKQVDAELKTRFYSDRLKGLRKPKTKVEISILDRAENTKRAKLHEIELINDNKELINDNKEFINNLLSNKMQTTEPTTAETITEPTPEPTPLSYIEVFPAVSRCTAGEDIAKEGKRILKNVLFKDGEIVATDTYILVIVKCDYPEELEGVIVDSSVSPVTTDGKFPNNYKKLIDFHGSEVDEVIRFTYSNSDIPLACRKIKNAPSELPIPVLIQIGNATYAPDRVLKVLEVFEARKEEYRVYVSSKEAPVLVLRSDSVTALVMPVINTKNATVFSVNRALEYGVSLEPAPSLEQDEPVAEYKTPEPVKETFVDAADLLAKALGIKRTLHIDIETYSPVDLKKSGVYVYASHPEFEITLFAYAFDNEPVQLVDFMDMAELPEEVTNALTDQTITKKAHNAAFERICISKYLNIDLPINQWQCTAVLSAVAGYPLSLDAVTKALRLAEGKMSEGRALIRYFCVPCKPTKTNGERTRNLPYHDYKKWETFKEYCIKDVEAERAISKALSYVKITDTEQRLYILDQQINDRGVLVNPTLINNAIRMDAAYKEGLTEEITDLTSLSNPNSVSQLKAWLSEEMDMDVNSLTKEAILNLLADKPTAEVAKVLSLRQEMAKTSVKKYQAMLEALGDDNRVRGLLQFYGANRTGRWAGRLVQVQNLPQNHLPDLDSARNLVLDNDLEFLEILFGNVPDTLSQLIRTAFVAPEGHTFIVADYSAIEARVIAWLADEKWRLEVFATHGKIYEASASKMFNVPIESVTKGSALRQKGKVSELALGYQGGPNALITMGALKMGILEDELQELVSSWREANPSIVDLWAKVNRAAIKAVDENTTVNLPHGVSISASPKVLNIHLPSGRALAYVEPELVTNRFGKTGLSYMNMDQTTKRWERVESYGGKLVENIVQAIARDCLADALLILDGCGYRAVMHVHDEVVIEVPVQVAEKELRTVTALMGLNIPWAKGLHLTADGYLTNYYKKD